MGMLDVSSQAHSLLDITHNLVFRTNLMIFIPQVTVSGISRSQIFAREKDFQMGCLKTTFPLLRYIVINN